MTLPRSVKLLKASKLVGEPGTVLDYGCGTGTSQTPFETMGFTYAGWDINRDQSAPSNAELVNLSYVLNVLPNQAERLAVLNRAWKLADKAMLITIPSGFQLAQTHEHEQLMPEQIHEQRVKFSGWTKHNFAWLAEATRGNVTTLSSDVFLVSRGECYVQNTSSVFNLITTTSQAFGVHRRKFMQWLAVAIGGAVILGPSQVAAVETIGQRVTNVIVDQLGVATTEVTVNANLVNDLGADSLDVVEVIFALELEFDISIPDDVAAEMTTVWSIISYIEAHSN